MQATDSTTIPTPAPRILVVSDFHMTGGIDPHTGLCSPTEDFFDDAAFADFLAHHTDSTPTTLVINGDLFDFLQVIETVYTPEMQRYGIRAEEVDPVYGLQSTENTTRYLTRRIVEGHPTFFRALVSFMAAGDNHIKITKGNHDVQLFWPGVQRELAERMADLEPELGVRRGTTTERMEVLPWFYYVPGLVYIEHGNQYEYTTSYQNFLAPKLPFDYSGTANHIELDLSGFLVRYLTNRLERINPMADNIRPLMRYWEWMWKNYPLQFLQTAGTALRFLLKAFSKARAIGAARYSEAYRAIERENREAIRRQAERFNAGSGLSPDEFNARLLRIDAMKEEPTLQRGAWRFLWRMLRQPLVGMLFLAAAHIVVLSVIPNLAAMLRAAVSLEGAPAWLHWIVERLWEVRAPQIAFGVAVVGLLIALRHAFRRRGEQAPESLSGNPVRTLRTTALAIADLLNVPFVTFGHTHYADLGVSASGRRYYNTGSWMQIANEEEQLYRNARQMAFLEIEGGEARLKQWEPLSRTVRDVVVMNTEAPAEADEGSLLVWLLKWIVKK